MFRLVIIVNIKLIVKQNFLWKFFWTEENRPLSMSQIICLIPRYWGIKQKQINVVIPQENSRDLFCFIPQSLSINKNIWDINQ